jgi:hypothetical protein
VSPLSTLKYISENMEELERPWPVRFADGLCSGVWSSFVLILARRWIGFLVGVVKGCFVAGT